MAADVAQLWPAAFCMRKAEPELCDLLLHRSATPSALRSR